MLRNAREKSHLGAGAVAYLQFLVAITTNHRYALERGYPFLGLLGDVLPLKIRGSLVALLSQLNLWLKLRFVHLCLVKLQLLGAGSILVTLGLHVS